MPRLVAGYQPKTLINAGGVTPAIPVIGIFQLRPRTNDSARMFTQGVALLELIYLKRE